MAKAHGGKRTGAGRKPKSTGTKSANFNTRITPETRAAIEAEARETGMSMSKETENLIKEALAERRHKARNSSTRAICYLLGELAEMVAPKSLNTERFTFDWRNDPFLFEAFRESFNMLMDGLRPAGETVSPPEQDPALNGTNFLGPLDTPTARAEHCAKILLHNFNAAREEPQDMLQHSPLGLDAKTYKKIAATPYDLHRAWKGLNEGKRK